MSKSKKPTLQIGEFLPPMTHQYRGYLSDTDSRHFGDYVVELGAEFKDRDNRTFRHVKVNGRLQKTYAMVHEAWKTDRKILRDEIELRDRATSLYIYNFLVPLREEEERKERAQQVALGWQSPDNWAVEVSNHAAVIQPIGFRVHLSHSTDPVDDRQFDAERAHRTKVLERIVELVKRYGFEDKVSACCGARTTQDQCQDSDKMFDVCEACHARCKTK